MNSKSNRIEIEVLSENSVQENSYFQVSNEDYNDERKSNTSEQEFSDSESNDQPSLSSDDESIPEAMSEYSNPLENDNDPEIPERIEVQDYL